MDKVTDFSAIPPDLLADAFEALAEGIAIYDADERLVACNARYKELLGPMADMIEPGMHWRDLIHGCVERGVVTETAEGGEDWVALSERQRDGHEQSTEIRQLNGRTYQISYHPTKSGGFVVTREDITEMRQAETMARDREALLKIILDTNPTPVVMGRLKDAKVLYRSPAATEAYGPEEYTTAYYSSDAERNAYVKALRDHGRVEDFIIRARRADGTEGMVSLSGGLTEYNGDLCAVSSVTDLTERLEREELIRQVVESCPAPVLMNRAATGEILYKSPELIALFGDGDNAGDFYVHRSDREGFLAALRPTGELTEYRSRFRNAHGETIWVAVSARLIEWDGEEVIVSYARDLSSQLAIEDELSRQREQMFQSEKMSALGSLLAGVAHELNNPLSVVVGHAMMLGDEVEDPDVLRQVKKIADAAERCARIVKTFLTMARQEPTRMEETDLNEIVQTAIDVARYGKSDEIVRVETHLDPETPRIAADPDQITQVILNLVLNAEQAIEKDGVGDRVRIVTRRDPKTGMARLEVEDNGPGIPREIRARVFEPFFTTKEVGEGTGIGLAMCHRIVTTHGGTISIDKDHMQGACFVMQLPPAAPGLAPEAPASPGETAPTTCRVLVIDDEVEVADLNAEVLTRGGFEAEVVYRAEEALEKLRKGQFDVIISDLNMPGLDGRGVFDAIRTEFSDMLERTGFITGDTLGQSSQTFLEESKRPFLEKPVSPRELREFVSQLSRREAT